jgi:hypothetical protein
MSQLVGRRGRAGATRAQCGVQSRWKHGQVGNAGCMRANARTLANRSGQGRVVCEPPWSAASGRCSVASMWWLVRYERRAV